jgi:hypothetical protein
MHGETVKTKINEKCSLGAELFHADGRTDGDDEFDSRFSNFCELAK